MANNASKFAYYKRLRADQKRIYDKSDLVDAIRLKQSGRFSLVLCDLRLALKRDNNPLVKSASQRIISGLCTIFSIPNIKVKVLSRRPSKSWGEMHGLYEADEDKMPVLTVWMRTAKRKNPVAFKTFLRTLVHEFMHHMDFAYFKFNDSFHTAGFYKRESSLLKQLMSAID